MTDADIASRARAYDRDNRLVAWTPEAVQNRLAESCRVFDLTPMRIGPSGAKGFWPNVVVTWEDLIDEKDKDRLMAAYGGEVDWKYWVDTKTVAQLSRDRANAAERAAKFTPPSAGQYSRAEEAFRWPAQFLSDKPLLADALTTWAVCIGCGLSLRQRLQVRREIADEFLASAKFHGKKLRTSQIIASRQDVFPGKNFNDLLLRERRKQAAAIVCRALVKARVVMREADAAPEIGVQE